MKAAIPGTRALTHLALALLLCGCNTAGSGGGGAAQDPLAEFQLGQDDEFDANVGAITTADNEGAACLELDVVFEDEDVLAALKSGYPSGDPADEFPSFVANTAQLERAKIDEICDTTLENAPAELLELTERLTTAANQNNECLGQEQDVTDDDSLTTLKKGYFEASVHRFASMTEFAEDLVADVEEVVAQGCE